MPGNVDLRPAVQSVPGKQSMATPPRLRGRGCGCGGRAQSSAPLVHVQRSPRLCVVSSGAFAYARLSVLALKGRLHATGFTHACPRLVADTGSCSPPLLFHPCFTPSIGRPTRLNQGESSRKTRPCPPPPPATARACASDCTAAPCIAHAALPRAGAAGRLRKPPLLSLLTALNAWFCPALVCLVLP